jgi:hypothetical protein
MQSTNAGIINSPSANSRRGTPRSARENAKRRPDKTGKIGGEMGTLLLAVLCLIVGGIGGYFYGKSEKK